MIALILAIHYHYSLGLPAVGTDEDDQANKVKRSKEGLLPGSNFSPVTKEKLEELKELARTVQDPKLNDLYLAVSHYVQMARKNNEYVLWKYDTNQEGLVLVLKQNLNGILYYG